MNIKSKIAALTLATFTVAGGLAATTQNADAGWKHKHHIGYGFAAGAMLGMAAAGAYASGPVYYAGSCRWVRQYDQFGFYVGKRRICTY